MGLDNGIRVKNLPKEYYECFTDIDNSTPKNGEVEICYWRKCYNIRDIFLSTFKVIKNGKITNWEGDGTFKIESEDIPVIIRKFMDLLYPENWDEDKSIWTYDEIRDSLLTDIFNLKMLYVCMKKNPNIEAYFYDSY